LQRTFRYIYSNNGAWGTVKSAVIQQQTLRLFDDGRMMLDIRQSMPDLPMSEFVWGWGLGECLGGGCAQMLLIVIVCGDRVS
jgi:hypothetical protein